MCVSVCPFSIFLSEGNKTHFSLDLLHRKLSNLNLYSEIPLEARMFTEVPLWNSGEIPVSLMFTWKKTIHQPRWPWIKPPRCVQNRSQNRDLPWTARSKPVPSIWERPSTTRCILHTRGIQMGAHSHLDIRMWWHHWIRYLGAKGLDHPTLSHLAIPNPRNTSDVKRKDVKRKRGKKESEL